MLPKSTSMLSWYVSPAQSTTKAEIFIVGQTPKRSGYAISKRGALFETG